MGNISKFTMKEVDNISRLKLVLEQYFKFDECFIDEKYYCFYEIEGIITLAQIFDTFNRIDISGFERKEEPFTLSCQSNIRHDIKGDMIIKQIYKFAIDECNIDMFIKEHSNIQW